MSPPSTPVRACRVLPLEPTHYDLVDEPGAGSAILRVQVKTCTTKQGGSWICWITHSGYAALAGGKKRQPYAADTLDVLAVVDGDLAIYLIPFAVIAGKQTLTLRAYEVDRSAQLTLANA